MSVGGEGEPGEEEVAAGEPVGNVDGGGEEVPLQTYTRAFVVDVRLPEAWLVVLGRVVALGVDRVPVWSQHAVIWSSGVEGAVSGGSVLEFLGDDTYRFPIGLRVSPDSVSNARNDEVRLTVLIALTMNGGEMLLSGNAIVCMLPIMFAAPTDEIDLTTDEPIVISVDATVGRTNSIQFPLGSTPAVVEFDISNRSLGNDIEGAQSWPATTDARYLVWRPRPIGRTPRREHGYFRGGADISGLGIGLGLSRRVVIYNLPDGTGPRDTIRFHDLSEDATELVYSDANGLVRATGSSGRDVYRWEGGIVLRESGARLSYLPTARLLPEVVLDSDTTATWSPSVLSTIRVRAYLAGQDDGFATFFNERAPRIGSWHVPDSWVLRGQAGASVTVVATVPGEPSLTWIRRLGDDEPIVLAIERTAQAIPVTITIVTFLSHDRDAEDGDPMPGLPIEVRINEGNTRRRETLWTDEQGRVSFDVYAFPGQEPGEPVPAAASVEWGLSVDIDDRLFRQLRERVGVSYPSGDMIRATPNFQTQSLPTWGAERYRIRIHGGAAIEVTRPLLLQVWGNLPDSLGGRREVNDPISLHTLLDALSIPLSRVLQAAAEIAHEIANPTPDSSR